MKFACLLYHGLGEERRFGYISPQRFRAQIAGLLGSGFTIEGLDGVSRRLESGDWPSHYLVLTFDDGHRSNVEALDILEELGAQATFFVTTRACRRDRRYLDAATIRRLAGHMHIGSHSVTHRRLDQLPDHEVHRELAESKAWIEDVTGNVVDAFSAPSGAIDRRVATMALELGYELLADSIPWWNRPETVARQRRIHRVAVDYAFPEPRYAAMSRCSPGFFLPKRGRALLLSLPKRLLFTRRMERIRKPILSVWRKWR